MHKYIFQKKSQESSSKDELWKQSNTEAKVKVHS